MNISQELKKADTIKCNDYVLSDGGPPPQPSIPEGLDEQDVFLFAAWAHGLEVGEMVMKHALYNYIQSHVQCRSCETLEKFLTTSYYWFEHKNGKFELSEDGMVQLKRFGEMPEKVELNCTYTFSRVYKGKTFSVMVEPTGHKKMFIDNMHTTAAEIFRKLRKDDIEFSKFESSWTPDKVFSWLIYDQDYTWVRS